MKYIITGGLGFIGSHLYPKLKKNNKKVLLIDNLYSGITDNIKDLDNDDFINMDIRNIEIEKYFNENDIVIHLAAISSLPECQSEPVLAFNINVLGTLNILEICRKKNIKKIIFASTSAIYENNEIFPVKEHHTTNPSLIYSLSKHSCEQLCLSYIKNYNLDISIIRFFNVYGGNQDFRRDSPPLTSYILKCLLSNKSPLLHSNSDQGVYNYLYDTSQQDLSSAGSIRRLPTATYPATTFATSHWRTSTGTSHLSASAAGDPHITTLTGEHYKFEHFGAFRLLEDEIDGESLIINGCSEYGKTSRRNKRQYIKKLYIKHGEKYILLDTGFRGEEVKVLEESGFFYTEEKLPFDKEAKRYSCKLGCTYSTKDPNEPVTEYLPAFMRNQISFSIDAKDNKSILNIIIQNVNEYNLQPCRLAITIGETPLTKNAKGCIIDRKYAPTCKLEDIKSMELLKEPTLEDLKNIPELEINPKLQNKQLK